MHRRPSSSTSKTGVPLGSGYEMQNILQRVDAVNLSQNVATTAATCIALRAELGIRKEETMSEAEGFTNNIVPF